MWRKATVALCAMMGLALLALQEATAQGVGDRYRAGGLRAAGIATAGPGYRYRAGNRPWRRYAVAPVAGAVVAGAGFAYAAYPVASGYFYNGVGYGNYYANGYGYYPSYTYDGDTGFGGCAIVHRRIPTAEGWVMQPVQLCN